MEGDINQNGFMTQCTDGGGGAAAGAEEDEGIFKAEAVKEVTAECDCVTPSELRSADKQVVNNRGVFFSITLDPQKIRNQFFNGGFPLLHLFSLGQILHGKYIC